MKLRIYDRVRFPLDKYTFRSAETAQFDIANNTHFGGSCFKPSILLQAQTKLSGKHFVEKVLLITVYSAMQSFFCLPKDEDMRLCLQPEETGYFVS